MITVELKKDIHALLSDEDKELANVKWGVNSSTAKDAYARRKVKIPGSRGKTKGYLLHRVVMERVLGRKLEKHEIVDHINRNKLDCQRENLRLVTSQENRFNSAQQLNKMYSQYIGVTWNKSANKYQANCKRKYLGLFEDEVEAALAYDKHARSIDGDSAIVNFPEVQ